MPGDGSAQNSPKFKSAAGPKSSSRADSKFIYPVRSLLSNVQPARHTEQVLRVPPDAARAANTIRSDSLSDIPENLPLNSPTYISTEYPTGNGGYFSLDSAVNTVATHSAPTPRRKSIANPSLGATSRFSTAMQRLSRSSNEPKPKQPPFPERDPDEIAALAAANAPLAQAAARAFASSQGPISFSRGGYVHLGPPSGSESDKSNARSHRNIVVAAAKTASLTGSGASHPGSGSAHAGSSGVEASGETSSFVSARSEKSLSSIKGVEPLLSFRFEHVQNENGHHIITGREGKLTRCEDEPIRVPGAVQSYGVLIALEEDFDTGSLVVRQVSENSSEILGLSPRYLFSLDCFTRVLPEHQADILWDNIEYLGDFVKESMYVSGNVHQTQTLPGEDDCPQVFQLSGYGEPGSAMFKDELDNASGSADGEGSGSTSSWKSFGGRSAADGRLIWSCWCAIYRAPSTRVNPNLSGEDNSNKSSSSPHSTHSLIILEFELERDDYNPLYPPPDVSSSGSGSFGSTPPSIHSNDSLGGSNQGETGSTTTVGTTDHGFTPVPAGTVASGLVRPLDSTLDEAGKQLAWTGSGEAQKKLHDTLTEVRERYGTSEQVQGLEGENNWFPSNEAIFESTTNRARPIPALERMRRMRKAAEEGFTRRRSRGRSTMANDSAKNWGIGIGTMDVFSVLTQVNEQFSAAQDLPSFLKIVVGVVKDLTQFHRVSIYQFDEHWNGQVVAELVDWSKTHDLYNSLHFPASDIPAQARELYAINKVRLLYDREQTPARMVVRNKRDLEQPLDMTHSFLRAMSPVHVKYLRNMGVRASMSISLVTFGALWGLILCHSYGNAGMRVSFPVRQLLRLLGDSVSRNIERLSYSQRLQTRKLISTMSANRDPNGYLVTNAEDLLTIFDADFGVLVIGDGAKILGPNQHSQEILIVSEYLRLKQFKLMQVSQAVIKDFPDLQFASGMDVIAGLLHVPLTSSGKDFIAFLRKGQLREVHWAGRPFKEGLEGTAVLEPRKSFKMWSETVAGRCRPWTNEQLETASVLSLVFGKFIEVWRQKESALQNTQLTNLLLANASHEVRTPLNHIINYLEMALDGPLDIETRMNLLQSHTASKGLLFTINDLLDLTRLESGNDMSFNEPFDVKETLADAVHLYSGEAKRRGVAFVVNLSEAPSVVVGDSRKLRTIVANLTANAVKFTQAGTISVECRRYDEPEGLRNDKEVVIEVVISDTGCGIPQTKLESMFRAFEQVESTVKAGQGHTSLGLGLAVVARIIEQLGGQLHVNSEQSKGSRFSFLIPYSLDIDRASTSLPPGNQSLHLPHGSLRSVSSASNRGNDFLSTKIDVPDVPLGSDTLDDSLESMRRLQKVVPIPHDAKIDARGPNSPMRGVKIDPADPNRSPVIRTMTTPHGPRHPAPSLSDIYNDSLLHLSPQVEGTNDATPLAMKLRVLVVEDDAINRNILAKRLKMDGHDIVTTTNGLEGVEMIEADYEFDVILMDIQMPLLNGFEATERIREYENRLLPGGVSERVSHKLNGRIPIFAVSASLRENQREDMCNHGIDGWILKPIDFKRLRIILQGIVSLHQRERDLYHSGCNWEAGGWLLASRQSH